MILIDNITAAEYDTGPLPAGLHVFDVRATAGAAPSDYSTPVWVNVWPPS